MQSNFKQRGPNMNLKSQIIIAFAAFSILALCSAGAASASSNPFQGTFSGTAIGDSDSSAQLTLNLAQNGTSVAGTATIGNGLKVDTGGFICPGLVPVPTGTIPVTGSASAEDPTHLEAKSSLSGSGLTITGGVTADLSKDGKTMDIELNLEVPWPCHGTIIKAKLARSQ
jgi:hypothetical protein